MELKELLEKQKKLDKFITKRYDPSMQQKDFLVYRLLALHVEVSELANATRSFKYWSEKEPEAKKRILSEYADVLHFFLSVGHALNFTAEEIEEAYLEKHEENYKRQLEGY
ncbi:hypothetical protein EXM60_14580 [Clostridium botulinum]|nr:hypothetical protein [Clostridium botulinum]NFA17682.1 hypothetical protein [Clostridium botulinum]NFA54358.1 hypothetical protein [Clostridium botulinum]NFA67884.1 hypothetical protein [Clostridium botulinum]NFE17018.1 hypothetical protein [Clostridium botulinum]